MINELIDFIPLKKLEKNYFEGGIIEVSVEEFIEEIKSHIEFGKEMIEHNKDKKEDFIVEIVNSERNSIIRCNKLLDKLSKINKQTTFSYRREK